MGGLTRRDLIIGIAGTAGKAIATPAFAASNDILPKNEHEACFDFESNKVNQTRRNGFYPR